MKRRILHYCFIIAATLTLILCLTSSASAAKYLGDIDGDGTVTASDARAVLRMSVGLEDLVEIEEHVYVEKTEKEATCTSDGVKNFTCAKCTHSYSLPVPATGHSWSAATCTKAKTCKTCKITEGTAKGHSWTAATCTTAKTCKTCKATDGSALGHNWNFDDICKTCGDTATITINLPEAPLEVSYISSYSGKLSSTKITKIYYNASTARTDVYFDIEKTYEASDSAGLGDQCYWECKLYDSEGYLIDNKTVHSSKMNVGEKQKGISATFWDLTKGETYTLVVENHT